MRSLTAAACLSLGALHAGADIFESFESSTPGQLPGVPWSDISTAIDRPTVPTPTGAVIETTGPSGALTRAFQISVARGTSQGIIADITPIPIHHVAADIRIDRHPSPAHYGDWNASLGFIQDRPVATDINQNPQAVVYAYLERWYFFGATNFSSNFVNIELGPAPVVTGEWYHVELAADTTVGSFTIDIWDQSGAVQVARTVSVPNWKTSLGAYNRLAAFDGDYSGKSAQSGQFTIDDIVYTPSPGAPLALSAVAMPGLTRRRRASGRVTTES